MRRAKIALGLCSSILALMVFHGALRAGEDQRLLWVTSRPVSKGETISGDSVVQKAFPAQTVPQGAVQDPREILGMRATRNLAPGTILRKDQFRPDPILRRGQRVQIVLEREGLRITAPGEALEEGAAGERIKVINTFSRQVITARVADTGRVLVDF